MKAAFIRSHGGPDSLEVGDLPDPVAAEGEVLIEVRAASLNHIDIWVRGGRSDPSLKLPHVLGSDAAGVVVSLGPGAHGVSEGEEVVVYPGLSCGCCEFCLRGEQSECARFGIIGLSRPGTFAEQLPSEYCQTLCALDFRLGPTREVAVCGSINDERTRELLAAVRRRFMPNKVVAAFDPLAEGGRKIAALVPLPAGRTLDSGRPTVCVCEDYACRQPATSAAELDKQLAR